MRYFSLFSGIGGFELGIQNAYEDNLKQQHFSKESKQEKCQQGRKRIANEPRKGLCSSVRSAPLCVGYSEIDKYAISVYKYHFPTHKNYGDITKIVTSELPDFDSLVGGFPCQSFSIAGKRGGFQDTRGTLFFEIARIAKVKRPAYLLLENVKGLLNHDKGNTFATIISTLDELGYDCEWSVLNSKNFGVPQNRERVFIIGHLRGKCGGKVFPFGEISEVADETRSGKERKISRTITKRYGKDGKECLIEITKNQSQGYRVYDPQGLATSQASQAGGVGAKTGLYTIPVLTPDRLVKRQNGRRFKEDGEPSFTLNTQDKHGIFNGSRIRRLTPTECERLQAFPDNWTKWGINEKGEKVEISDSQRYKMCGNALTTNVVAEIIKELF